MKQVTAIGTMIMLFVFAIADAQDRTKQNTIKKKQATEQQQELDSVNQNAASENTGTPPSAGDTELLGDTNDKSKRNSDQNPSSDYRNNKVSGNPNNRNVNEGSNRRAEPQNGRESSNAAPAVNPHNTNQTITDPGSPTPVDELGTTTESSEGNTAETGDPNSNTQGPANPQTTNAPAVTQESSSQSGSPAVLSEENGSDRDGTNNVQRAEPNMVGSPVKGLKTKGSVDQDKEIRKGTNQQMNAAGSQGDLNTTDTKQDQAQPNQTTNEQQPNNTANEEQPNNTGLNTSDNTNTAPSRVKRSVKPKEADKDHDENPGLDHPDAGRTNDEANDPTKNEMTVPAMDQNPNLITEEDEEDKKEKRRNKKKNKRSKRNRD